MINKKQKDKDNHISYSDYLKEELKDHISYSDYLKEELKDCIWINHPHTRLSFFEKWFYWFIFVISM